MTFPHLRRRLGLKVRALREDRGMTQLSLAFAAGLTPARISEIESGKREARLSSLLRIAQALHVELSALF